MVNITKEYFDTTIKNLETGIKTFIEKGNQELRTEFRGEIKELRTEFHSEIQDLRTEFINEVQELARMVAEGFEDLEERLDVKERVEKLEREFVQLKQALRV